MHELWMETVSNVVWCNVNLTKLSNMSDVFLYSIGSRINHTAIQLIIN